MGVLQTAGAMGVIFIGLQAFIFWKNRTDLAFHDELKTRKRGDIVTQLEWERQKAIADAPPRVLNKNALMLDHLDVSRVIAPFGAGQASCRQRQRDLHDSVCVQVSSCCVAGRPGTFAGLQVRMSLYADSNLGSGSRLVCVGALLVHVLSAPMRLSYACRAVGCCSEDVAAFYVGILNAVHGCTV